MEYHPVIATTTGYQIITNERHRGGDCCGSPERGNITITFSLYPFLAPKGLPPQTRSDPAPGAGGSSSATGDRFNIYEEQWAGMGAISPDSGIFTTEDGIGCGDHVESARRFGGPKFSDGRGGDRWSRRHRGPRRGHSPPRSFARGFSGLDGWE